MKFTSLLKTVILENAERIDFLIDTYAKPKKKADGTTKKPKMSVSELAALVAADPKSKLNDIDIESANAKELANAKAGKYTNWIIKSYLNLNQQTEIPFGESGYEREVKILKDRFMEDLYKLTDDLKKFDRFKSKLPLEKRQIHNLTPDSLYDAVKDFDLTLATTTKSERKSAPVHPGAELMYDGDQWRVIKITDKGVVGKEAACFYGGNNQETRWCTSAPGASWFDRYIKDGPLYVVFNPNDTDISQMTGLPKTRYQFHFPSNQFMDKDDRQIDLVQYLMGPMSELKNVFKPEFAKGLTVGGDKLAIDNFKSGAVGKFIALYGLDELIENLPVTLKEFQIQNRDKDEIIIKIPSSIGRFKNLDMILLDNCIDSLPEEIGELKALRFLALPNNKRLTQLPDSISGLPNLFFLNVKGSSNVKIPESILSRAEDMCDGCGMYDLNPA
jgi:hypothetical protein